jgi:hypothetical protein
LPGSDRSTDGSTSGAADTESGARQDAGLDEAIDATIDGDAASEASLSALAAYCQRAGPAAVDCGTVPAECESSWIAGCSNLDQVFSPSYIWDQIACSDPTSCSDAQQPCSDTGLPDASPTAAQSGLGQDYCATCSIGAEACDALDYDLGPNNVLTFSDLVARRVDEQCTGAALVSWVQSSGIDPEADCITAFGDCEAAVIADESAVLLSELSGCLADAGAQTGESDAAPIDAGVEDAGCFPGSTREPLRDAGLCDDGGASGACEALVERCEAGVVRRVTCHCGLCTCTVDNDVVATISCAGCCTDQCPF